VVLRRGHLCDLSDCMADMTTLEQLKKEIGRPWYSYGRQSPRILFARMRSKHRPVFRLRMAWQRATRGYDDSMLWGLDYALAKLTVAGVQAMRKWQNGYPNEFSDPPIGGGGGWEAWDDILRRIEEGFQAWLDEDGWFNGKPEQEVKFRDGMDLYAYWFSALWD
jgi:hypothetical protein